MHEVINNCNVKDIFFKFLKRFFKLKMEIQKKKNQIFVLIFYKSQGFFLLFKGVPTSSWQE